MTPEPIVPMPARVHLDLLRRMATSPKGAIVVREESEKKAIDEVLAWWPHLISDVYALPSGGLCARITASGRTVAAALPD